MVWLLSFVSPEISVQGELERARSVSFRALEQRRPGVPRRAPCSRGIVHKGTDRHLGRGTRSTFLGLWLLLRAGQVRSGQVVTPERSMRRGGAGETSGCGRLRGTCIQRPSSQVKLLLPKFHRADSALRSQAAGGVGVCASVAPPAFGCRLG